MPTCPNVVKVPDAAPASDVGTVSKAIEVCGMISTIIPMPATVRAGVRLQPLRSLPSDLITIMTQPKAAAWSAPPSSTACFPSRFMRSMATGVPIIEPIPMGSSASPAENAVKPRAACM